MALLLAAHEAGLLRGAATVDHGLRPEAAAEARWAAALCARLGVPHATLPLSLRDGPGLQDRARTARYAALAAWGAGRTVLVGHTADDVAETLAMRLGRGVGLRGLAAMPDAWEVDGTPFARPFLPLTRAHLRDWLRARGETWLEDPSNDDPRFERARLRAAMASLGWDAEALARSARALREASRSLGAHAAEIADRAVRETAAGEVLIEEAAIPEGAAEQRRRLWLFALARVGGRPAPRGAELARAMAATASHALAGCIVTPGAPVRIAREVAACPSPGPATAPWDGWRVEGPALGALTVGALGDDVAQVPWRGTGLPRRALLATPALRRDGALVAAPVAGLAAGYRAALQRPPLAAAIRRHPAIAR
nr:tRNA lysidine(34) synthetase TilS [Jannaschia sp. W003]